MKTKLFAKSNAVLTCEENRDGKVLAIITCGKKEDISKKVVKAIKDHYVAKSVSIFEGEKEVLTNQSYLIFGAEVTEDGVTAIKEFCLEVIATY